MEKLKVLIVDDEHLIRNLLRMRIDWDKQGMTIAGEASNAREALEMVDELRPDIMFTDIHMPSISGIELSRMVLDKYPDIKIVIVTGHDEFEYAHESIKIGITDFILKPIRASELLHVTEKLNTLIREERSRDQELERLKEELKRNFPYLREKFVNGWLSGTLSQEEILEKAKYFSIPVQQGSGLFHIAVIEVSPASDELDEEQQQLLNMDARNKAAAYYEGDSGVITLTDTRNQIVVLSWQVDADLASDCEHLKTILAEPGKCLVSIGIGRPREAIEEAYIIYREACRALEYKAFVGRNQVVCFEDMVDSREQPYRPSSELLQQLEFCISVGSEEQAAGILHDMFNVSFTSVSQFRMAAMEVITECQRAAMEQQLEDEQVFNKETLVSILAAEHLPELTGLLESYVLSITGAIHAKHQTKEDNLISQVKEYLEQNMGDSEVGLASTAAAFYVSPGHLGRLMKKETGQTFVEYLTNIRMKKAETLLKTTDLRGYEVGEQVGIKDPHYFSVLFKKNTGRSVNEYRSSK
ncbi:two-component system response regulator [Paenibacillus sambharensis]|uniref:Two-component system response regulator n=1 Tax=Paenibacillus sambharensis TaxID=1803190 RepID=A0A2W1LK31_9BACL|nr:response regulator [Paenibacillus sambharensis]PZD95265.1 two-component system response regulator [Paenibacillus sambharensis]